MGNSGRLFSLSPFFSVRSRFGGRPLVKPRIDPHVLQSVKRGYATALVNLWFLGQRGRRRRVAGGFTAHGDIHWRWRGARSWGFGFEAGRACGGDEIDELAGFGAVGIFVGIVLGHVEAQKIFVLDEFGERGRDAGEGNAAGAGDIDAAEVGIGDGVDIEVQEEFAGVRMEVSERFLRGLGGAFEGDVGGVNAAHGGLGEEVLLGRVETFEAEEGYVRFANQRLLAPEADEFGSPLADDVGDDHAIDAAGGCGGGSIEVGVAIKPEEIEMPVVAASGSEEANDLRAITTENEDKSAALDRYLGASAKVIEAGDDFGEVAGAAMFLIIGKKAGSAVAMVDDFKTGILQALDKPGCAQGRGSLFAAGEEGGGTGWGANQGNLLRLTDDADRQNALRMP